MQKFLIKISALWLLAFFIINASVNGASAQARAAYKPAANGKVASVIINAKNGQVLFEENADAVRYPASLTKMMTLYLTFDALKQGKLKLDQKVRVSNHAASQPALKLWLRAGELVPVETLISSIVVRSANDSAVVLAEAVGRTESNFALLMTNKARQLGMANTTFRNASGLPNMQQKTTARELAKLSIALRRDFPGYYHFFNRERFAWRGVPYTSHNRVTLNYMGADGLKTGYINASGFNLATSVVRDGHSLVGIVLGGNTAGERDAKMMRLMDKAIATLKNQPDFKIAAESIQNMPASPKITDSGSEYVQQFQEYSGVPNPQIDDNSGGGYPGESAVNASQGGVQGEQGGRWGIQVGAYGDPKDALMAAANAVNQASAELNGSQIKVKSEGVGAGSVHRARLINLERVNAVRACVKLVSQNSHCFVFRN